MLRLLFVIYIQEDCHMKKVIYFFIFCIFMFYGCASKIHTDSDKTEINTETESNTQKLTYSGEFAEGFESVGDNIYDISELFDVNTEKMVGYKIFLDKGMFVLPTMEGYEIYPINYNEKKIEKEKMVFIPSIIKTGDFLWMCDRGLAHDEEVSSSGYYDKTYNRYIYELQEDGTIKTSMIGSYSVKKDKQILDNFCYSSDYVFYALTEDEECLLYRYNIRTQQEELIADLTSYSISSIYRVEQGEEGYVFCGNGYKDNFQNEQTSGIYCLIDNSGKVKNIVYDYDSERSSYNGGLFLSKKDDSNYNYRITEMLLLDAEKLETKVIDLGDYQWISGYTKIISENGKYIFFSDITDNLMVFVVYDTEKDEIVYKKETEIQEKITVISQSISEKYNGFTISFMEDEKIKTYFYKF